jgi:hypothetical protein
VQRAVAAAGGESRAAIATTRIPASCYSYVYAVALNSYGQVALALQTLEKTRRHFPGNRPILKVFARMKRDRGPREAALANAQSLGAPAPDDPESQALLPSSR